MLRKPRLYSVSSDEWTSDLVFFFLLLFTDYSPGLCVSSVGSLRLAVIIGVAVGAFLALIVLMGTLGAFCCARLQRSKCSGSPPSSVSLSLSLSFSLSLPRADKCMRAASRASPHLQFGARPSRGAVVLFFCFVCLFVFPFRMTRIRLRGEILTPYVLPRSEGLKRNWTPFLFSLLLDMQTKQNFCRTVRKSKE